MYRFYKGSVLNTTASGTTTGTAGMTGLTTGATNACTVRAIDRAGNEGEPYAINVPTKLYRWDKYGYIEKPKATDGTNSVMGYVICPNPTYLVTIGADNKAYVSYKSIYPIYGNGIGELVEIRGRKRLKIGSNEYYGYGAVNVYNPEFDFPAVARLERYMGYNQYGERLLWYTFC